MQKFYIRSRAHAEAILRAYSKCGVCAECALNSPEGWRCSYLAEQAMKYLEKEGREGNE